MSTENESETAADITPVRQPQPVPLDQPPEGVPFPEPQSTVASATAAFKVDPGEPTAVAAAFVPEAEPKAERAIVVTATYVDADGFSHAAEICGYHRDGGCDILIESGPIARMRIDNVPWRQSDEQSGHYLV